MKRWMKILCVLTVLVCVVWGAVSYFHYNTVRTLLNRAELADYTNSRELWYSRNLRGLGYTENALRAQRGGWRDAGVSGV